MTLMRVCRGWPFLGTVSGAVVLAIAALAFVGSGASGSVWAQGDSGDGSSLPTVSLVGETSRANEDILVNGMVQRNDIPFTLTVDPKQEEEELEVSFTVRFDGPGDNADRDDFLLSQDLVWVGEELKGRTFVRSDAPIHVFRLPLEPDTVAEAIEEHFTVVLDEPDFPLRYRLSETETEAWGVINDGVCDRTPVVRDALLEVVVGSDNCYDATLGKMRGHYRELSVRPEEPTEYKERDFADLPNLFTLSLYAVPLQCGQWQPRG